VAITLADVKSPAGDIKPSVWFPGVDSAVVDADLTGFIVDAYTQTDDDDAAEQWVYYRAATDVADRLSGQGGGSVTIALVDQLSKTTSTTPAGIGYWVQKAKDYLAAFNAANSTEAENGGFAILTSLRHG
jgi:hypothetical protein